MPQFAVKVNSYIGSDTRIQVVQERSPKPEKYLSPHLDRDAENETKVKNESDTAENPRRVCRSHRTQNRLTPHARAILQRIGGAVDVFFNAASSVFLTGTFPGESHECQSAIAEQAGWIVHRLKAWIYKRCGANIAWWAWEFQKRGTLHLHYIAVIPRDEDREYILSEFRNEWIRLIAGASKRCNQNLFIGRRQRDFFLEKELLQIYAKQVYRSATAYLAKYISKDKYGNFPAPCRLWGCTREARHLVAKHLISIVIPSIPLHKAEDLAYEYDSYSNALPQQRRYFRHRFSQGFTILLYDDSLRESLVRKKDFPNRDKPVSEALTRLNKRMIHLNVREELRGFASKPLRERLLALAGCDKPVTIEYDDGELKSDLMELEFIVDFFSVVPWYRKDELKNLIGAAIKCLE